MTRMSRDEYFLRIAIATAARSTCLDRQVGCVLVDPMGNIIATGYNGAPRGMEHCNECGVAQTGEKEVCPAAHAEQNAMLHAHCDNIDACYCTLEPCIHCTRMLMNTACRKVVFLKQTSKSGLWLWEKMNDTATWQYRPLEGISKRPV